MATSNEYVLGFAFNQAGTEVILIRKNKPDWQKGRLNGVGGKVEEGEDPFDAMVREFREETGVEVDSWKYFCHLVGDWRIPDRDWRVHCFMTHLPYFGGLHSPTDEKVGLYNIEQLAKEDVVFSLLYLIPMALDSAIGSADLCYTTRGKERLSILERNA